MPGLLLLAIAGSLIVTQFAPGTLAAGVRKPSTSSPHPGRIAALQLAVQNGTVQIPFAPISGYLNGLLSALEVPIESQVAVFSETSAQGNLVSPDNPRVIYFSDDISVA